MAKYEIKITGNFEEVVNHLQNDITNSGLTMELVDESNFNIGDMKIAVKVYDKYFMRNGNRASLSLTVVSKGRDIFISAIGAGGGQGIIFNFSLGAEEEMVEVVQYSIKQLIDKSY